MKIEITNASCNIVFVDVVMQKVHQYNKFVNIY